MGGLWCLSAGPSVPRHATSGSHSFCRPATGGWESWSSGFPVWVLWVFRLPLALEVPWECWRCLGASVLAQGAPQVLNQRILGGLISKPPMRKRPRMLEVK